MQRCLPSVIVVDVRLARKNSPEMFRASQRTTTTFWPLRSCLATIEARRPRRWPLPSTTTCEKGIVSKRPRSNSNSMLWAIANRCRGTSHSQQSLSIAESQAGSGASHKSPRFFPSQNCPAWNVVVTHNRLERRHRIRFSLERRKRNRQNHTAQLTKGTGKSSNRAGENLLLLLLCCTGGVSSSRCLVMWSRYDGTAKNPSSARVLVVPLAGGTLAECGMAVFPCK